MYRLRASQKRHRAKLFNEEKVQGKRGDSKKLVLLSTVKGLFIKKRGDKDSTDSLEVSTAQATFSCDYRANFESVVCIEVGGIRYNVSDVTNVDLANVKLMFDLERNL
ncbi:hypothetical protein [Pseudoalteromonas peptidolytica]|uniref:Uncharacterized protein n=1 Tax=Pseudoalteromonas peptidolytica F12-50-A1 TaxID=1315280 RepID=A0A8I0MZP5_9GAMM|nr:hypothetical protein [Pseudoalteromonas peptidolytica]MBE0348282.1 hypothetical protein [Pseudoalteromonas peptidolytica F12-50-A1]NLR16567.1 hypothetical protein [Pseudoalteromonas peptidolytica]GEK08937.1 hypothetical protein PPE03_11860 [Pseudoalteromonas peptidolytica]